MLFLLSRLRLVLRKVMGQHREHVHNILVSKSDSTHGISRYIGIQRLRPQIHYASGGKAHNVTQSLEACRAQ